MEKFRDHVACSVSLVYSEYYSKLYINVHKIVADGVLYIHSQILTYLKFKFTTVLIQNILTWQKCLEFVGYGKQLLKNVPIA